MISGDKSDHLDNGEREKNQKLRKEKKDQLGRGNITIRNQRKREKTLKPWRRKNQWLSPKSDIKTTKRRRIPQGKKEWGKENERKRGEGTQEQTREKGRSGMGEGKRQERAPLRARRFVEGKWSSIDESGRLNKYKRQRKKNCEEEKQEERKKDDENNTLPVRESGSTKEKEATDKSTGNRRGQGRIRNQWREN